MELGNVLVQCRIIAVNVQLRKSSPLLRDQLSDQASE